MTPRESLLYDIKLHGDVTLPINSMCSILSFESERITLHDWLTTHSISLKIQNLYGVEYLTAYEADASI